MRTLNDYSYSELLEIQRQLEEFQSSFLYKLFQEACYGNENLLLNSVIHLPVTGIDSIFKREADISAARSWSEMSEIFETLKSEVTTQLELKTR
jgi:hypothetical protein